MRTAITATMLAAMLGTSIPATAGERPRQDDRRKDARHGEGDGHHRRGDRDKGDDVVGGVVLGALLVGGIAAALGSKPSRTEIVAVEQPGPALPVETDADAAVSACAAAAEGEGRRTYALAQVGQVLSVAPDRDGYAVQGDVVLRTTYREPGDRRVFRCSVDSQAVRRIVIDGLAMLPR